MLTHSKGQKYVVEMTGVAWLDLLGYGSMLREVEFDPTHPKAVAAVDRLRKFQQVAASFATRTVRAMIINDGVAYVRELSPRGRVPTYEFLAQTYKAYRAVNQAEFGLDQIGARMIVAAGPRLRVPETQRPNLSHLKSIFNRVRKGVISSPQAIMEAANLTPLAGHYPSLQANFAFTKAYLADVDGSRGGFTGPKCFIDSAFFNQIPGWITSSKSVTWSTAGMHGTFLQIDNMDMFAARQDYFPEVRDAVEIANSLNITYPVSVEGSTRSPVKLNDVS